MKVVEYLEKVVRDNGYIHSVDMEKENFTISDDIQYAIEEELIQDVITIVDGTDEKKEFWETILPYLPEESISESSFRYFVEEGIGLTILSHMNLDDDKLSILSSHEEEALFTLGKRYYVDDRYSGKEFCRILKRYNSEPLFGQLLMLRPTNIEKENILYFFYEKFGGSDTSREAKEMIRAKQLLVTNNLNEIETMYNLNNHHYALALSRNLHTPDYILNELSHVKQMKNSSKIRANSIRTLKLKSLLE